MYDDFFLILYLQHRVKVAATGEVIEVSDDDFEKVGMIVYLLRQFKLSKMPQGCICTCNIMTVIDTFNEYVYSSLVTYKQYQ